MPFVKSLANVTYTYELENPLTGHFCQRPIPFFFKKFFGGIAPRLWYNRAMEPNEKELIAEVLAGHADSFEPLVVQHQSRVFALARRYARREDEVEDIVQTVFIKAFNKLESFRGDAPFEHWLMRMATFTCYDFLRKHQRNREWNASDLSDEENDWLENVGGESDDPTDRNAAKALVGKLLDGLKPDEKHIIILLEIEGKSVKEIAKITDFSESNVKVKAHRAREKMRKLLGNFTTEKYL